jgi:hypothetical protein
MYLYVYVCIYMYIYIWQRLQDALQSRGDHELYLIELKHGSGLQNLYRYGPAKKAWVQN